MTLADVGIAAGYSRGLPAHYFGNKTGLLEAIATHIVDGFANRLAETPRFKPGIEALLDRSRHICLWDPVRVNTPLHCKR